MNQGFGTTYRLGLSVVDTDQDVSISPVIPRSPGTLPK